MGTAIDLTQAVRSDVDQNGCFLPGTWKEDHDSAFHQGRFEAFCALWGVTEKRRRITLSRVANRKIAGLGQAGMPSYFPGEADVIPAVKWFDHTTMLFRREQGRFCYILATQPYGLRPEMADDLCAQVAPFDLEVGVFRNAGWWNTSTTLVLVARRGILPSTWA